MIAENSDDVSLSIVIIKSLPVTFAIDILAS